MADMNLDKLHYNLGKPQTELQKYGKKSHTKNGDWISSKSQKWSQIKGQQKNAVKNHNML